MSTPAPTSSQATQESHYCLCDCGEIVKLNRQFLPGHDQKLRLRIEGSVGGLEALKNLVLPRPSLDADEIRGFADLIKTWTNPVCPKCSGPLAQGAWT